MCKSILLCNFHVTIHDYRFEFHIREYMAEITLAFGVKNTNLNSEFYNGLTKFRLLSIRLFPEHETHLCCLKKLKKSWEVHYL